MIYHLDSGSLRTLFLGAFFCLTLPIEGIADSLTVGGTGAALGPVRTLAEAYSRTHPEMSIAIPLSLGSTGGINGAIAGALDIGLSTRPLKEKERKAGAKQLAFAKSPFVIVTAEGHAQRGLSSAEVVEIFSGARTSWADGMRILRVLRPEHDSDTTILKAAIAGMPSALGKLRKVRGIPVALSDQDAMRMAETIPGVVTTATLTAVLAENRSLSPVTIDGIAPTLENLTNGSYPMFKTLYVITGSKVRRPAMDFIRFIQSPDGARILREIGSLAIAVGE